MITRYEAIIDGIALSSINPDIIIHDINPVIGEYSYKTNTIAKRAGGLLTNEVLGSASVVISFEIHNYSIQKRQQICQDIIQWARGSVLETNDRKGQFLRGKCVSFPYVNSALEWTQIMTLTFSAFEQPYWQEKAESVLELSGTTNEGTLFVPGNAENTLVEAVITPVSTMANITINVGDTTMTLTGCGATTANPVVISYDSKRFLSINVGSTSILDKRTGDDDLLAVCGQDNEISYTASANVGVEIRARGLWM